MSQRGNNTRVYRTPTYIISVTISDIVRINIDQNCILEPEQFLLRNLQKIKTNKTHLFFARYNKFAALHIVPP